MKEVDDQAVALRPADMLSVLRDAATNPSVDVAKLTALWDLAERMQAKQAKIEFKAALSRLQAKLKQFDKKGKIIVKGVIRSRYAKYEDMDEVVRPMLAEEGFALSFDEEHNDRPEQRTFTATLSHKDGHEEIKKKTMPFDKSDFRSPAQSEGSTVSYARRALLKMHLNIVEHGEDTDGVNPSFINEDQLRDLETALKDTKSDTYRFLTHFHIAELKDLPEREYKEAMNMLDAKRRNVK